MALDRTGSLKSVKRDSPGQNDPGILDSENALGVCEAHGVSGAGGGIAPPACQGQRQPQVRQSTRPGGPLYVRLLHLSFGASIPVVICVLHWAKPDGRRGEVLFMDAIQEDYF